MKLAITLTDAVKMLASLRGKPLNSITPDGFEINIRTHDTATQCHIYMVDDNGDKLLVWYKTNWVSSNYEFNEEKKIIGIQNGCNFVKPEIDKIFIDAKKLLDEIAQNQISRANDMKKEELDQRNRKLEKFKSIHESKGINP